MPGWRTKNIIVCYSIFCSDQWGLTTKRLQYIQHSFRRSATFIASATTNTVNMDIRTLLNNFHEEVSCSVCMCNYTDPKQLPCLHSFCLHCLNGIQRTSGRREKIACPECRQEFKVPDNGNLAEEETYKSLLTASLPPLKHFLLKHF